MSRRTLYVEGVGLGEDRGVPVRGGEERESRDTGVEPVAVHLRVLARPADSKRHGRHAAACLLAAADVLHALASRDRPPRRDPRGPRRHPRVHLRVRPADERHVENERVRTVDQFIGDSAAVTAFWA
jgi:hypothetical protein